jgi:ABC-2 type transport system permease protein
MVVRGLKLIFVCARFNLLAAMEYRAAFISQALGMALNNSVLLLFWWFYFERFPSIEGWTWRDLIVLWGVVATSFGGTTILFGNTPRLAALIAEGQIDYYLTMPRNVLLHTLVTRMSLAGWGDLGFGLIALAVAASWNGPGFLPLAFVLIVLSGAVALAFVVIAGSLAFFIGNAETASRQAAEAMINFSLYPGPIFQGWVQVFLLTVLPAGFAAHVPVEILREFSLTWLASMAVFTVAIWVVALTVFGLGLRRYESGNLIVLRG